MKLGFSYKRATTLLNNPEKIFNEAILKQIQKKYGDFQKYLKLLLKEIEQSAKSYKIENPAGLLIHKINSENAVLINEKPHVRSPEKPKPEVKPINEEKDIVSEWEQSKKIKKYIIENYDKLEPQLLKIRDEILEENKFMNELYDYNLSFLENFEKTKMFRGLVVERFLESYV